MTNSTGFLPQIPQPFNGWLSWIFGPGWWVWLVLVVIVLGAWVANKGRVKTEKVLKEQPLTDVPSAAEYLEQETPEPLEQKEEESVEEEKPESEDDDRWKKYLHPSNPKEDPRLLKLDAAFEEVKDKMLASFTQSVKNLKPRVLLEDMEKKDLKVRDLVLNPPGQQPEPPTEEIIEETM